MAIWKGYQILICYLDESGNTGRRLDDPDQPFHLIAAVMVREDRIREMNSRLNELASQAPTTNPLTEYRGSDLFGGRGEWKNVCPRQRIDEYSKALSVLSQVEAGVAYASIYKEALAHRNYSDPNPHLFALQFLIEKLEKWITQPNVQEDSLSRRILLVADENHEQEQYSIDLMNEMLELGGPIGTTYGINITLDHFVDRIYFDKSERNRGIQLADLVAYIINRNQIIQRNLSNNKWDTVVKQLMHNYVASQLKTWRQPWPLR